MAPLRTEAVAVAAAALFAASTCDAFAFAPRSAASSVVASRANGRCVVRLMAESDDKTPFFATAAAATEDPPAVASTKSKSSSTQTVQSDVAIDAADALNSVGWSSPLTDTEFTSDDPFVKRIDDSIRNDMGVGLDELLNPAKVVNLERDIYNLKSELAYLTGMGTDLDVTELTAEECDGGGGGEEAEGIRASLAKKEKSLVVERRAVFRGWLKNVFLGQAVLSLALSWVMVSDPGSLFGGFGWYNLYNMDVSIRVLGFWWWWLFIVPSLRSRRPRGFEKKALDIAFLGTPLISILSPALTKDTELIWVANLAVVVGSYAFAYLTNGEDGDDGDDEENRPEWLKFLYKSLDFGSGRERGARK